MSGFGSAVSSRRSFLIPGRLLGSFRIRRCFFPVLFISTASFLVVFLATSLRYSSYYATFDPPKFVPCGANTPVSLMEIRYDEKEIARMYVREKTTLNKRLWNRIKPAMTTAEKQTLRSIFSIFIEISDAHNFTHFLVSGTLLGSYRHHGLMPWDDDADVLMRYSERDEVLRVFRNYSKWNEMKVETGNQERLKIFHTYRSIAVRGWRYRWPTIDVSFYDENDTHIWELSGQMKYHVLPKSLVFPLHRRPFEMLMINSPYDAFAVLRLLYADPTCITLSWDHRRESQPRGRMRFDCQITSRFYPFVHRKVRGECMEETMMLNGSVLYRITVEEPLYAISNPYVLKLVPSARDNDTTTSSDFAMTTMRTTTMKKKTKMTKKTKTMTKKRKTTKRIVKASNGSAVGQT